MTFGFDPVANELVVCLGERYREFAIPMRELVVKYYAAHAGTLSFKMDPSGVEIGFWPLPEEGGQLSFAAVSERIWRVEFFPQGAS